VRVFGSSHENPEGEVLKYAERDSVWKMVAASRETLFIGSGSVALEFQFNNESKAQLRLGWSWGDLTLDQYPQPTQCFHNPRLYAHVMSLTGAPAPPSVVAAIKSWARFRRERVMITIDRDSIQVRGRYVFLSDSAARPFAVRFPPVRTPGNPTLRKWSASIEDPRAGAMVMPRSYMMIDSGFVIFPGAPNDTVCVLANSGDLLYGGRSATYLLTTARAWGEPLDRAVLEVNWPDSLGVPRFSLPLVPAGHSNGRTLFRFEASPFRPDTDLVVKW
jgi:hypothetical protein